MGNGQADHILFLVEHSWQVVPLHQKGCEGPWFLSKLGGWQVDLME